MCKIYAAAIASITEGLPWVRAADVWHVSSILEHETVFMPKRPPIPSQQQPSPILHTTTKNPESNNNNNKSRTDNDAAIANDGRNDTDGGVEVESIGSLTIGSVGGGGDGDGRNSGARFCERVVGKTWSGVPAVVLRSLRVPGRDEAACTARWLRGNGEDGGGVFGNDEGWTDERLRLLADEWRTCTGFATAAAAAVAATATDLCDPAAAAAATPAAAVAPPRPPVPRPFTLHTGHVIVPFLNGRVRESYTTSRGKSSNNMVVGHGVVLAVDRGFDWRHWESHLTETAAVATRCFERLEHEGEVAERERVKLWREELLDRNPAGSSRGLGVG